MPLFDRLLLRDGDAVRLAEGVLLFVCEAVELPVCVLVLDVVDVCDDVPVDVPLLEMLSVGVPLFVEVAVPLPLCVGVDVIDALPVADLVALEEDV